MYILSADGRFPYLKPGDQKPEGDHFLALYPSRYLDISIPKRSNWPFSLPTAFRRVFGAVGILRGGFDKALRGHIDGNIKSEVDDNDEFRGWPRFSNSSSGKVLDVDSAETDADFDTRTDIDNGESPGTSNSSRLLWLQNAVR